MTRPKPVIRVGESPKARIFTGREAVAPDADIVFSCLPAQLCRQISTGGRTVNLFCDSFAFISCSLVPRGTIPPFTPVPRDDAGAGGARAVIEKEPAGRWPAGWFRRWVVSRPCSGEEF